MAGSTWPTLTAGAKAKASDVEARFDWIEGDIVPMSGGNKTNAAYDLGESANRWRTIYGETALLKSGANDLFAVTTTGAILTSRMPYFKVGVAANSTPYYYMTLTLASIFGLTSTVEYVDIGDNWTTAGYFLAPVTGLYHIRERVLFDAVTTTAEIDFGIQRNLMVAGGVVDEYYSYKPYLQPSIIYKWSHHVDWVGTITAGQTLTSEMEITGGSFNVVFPGSQYTYMTGRLLG